MYYGDDYIKNDTVFPPFMYAGKEVHYALGSILCLVGLFGILGNSLVLLVFTRFRRLQGPFSCLIINLAIGDLGTSCLHIMVVVSSFKGKWAFGYTGCVIYAFGVGFFGMMSIFTLAAISLERYLVITSRPLSSWKLTNRGARRDYIKNDTVFPPFMYAGKEVHYALGSILCLVGLFGILGNSLVLLVFTRFRRLQGPFSCLIINLAIGDLGTSCLHIMVVVSSFKGKWAFGYTGCVIYAFGVGFFGMMSIFTLAAISLERYLVITSRPLSSWKLTNRGARRVCYVSWIYCTGLTTPPIFGWSRYTLEGLFTSCSWDYTTRSLSNTIYYLYLLGFGFILPVSMITFCYTFIMTAVLAHGKEMATVDMTPGRSGRSARKCRNVNNAHGTALKTAEIILILIAFFMISWTPYATVTLIGHFGPEGVLSPWVTAMPAYFAKMSVIYNPIVYGLSHPHFQSSVKQYISSWRVSSSGSSCKQDEHYSTTKGGTVALNTIKHDRHFRCFLTKPLEDVESEGQLEEQDRRLFQETLYQHVRKDSSSLEPIGLSQGGISSSASTVSVNIHIKKLRECYV